MKWIRKYIRASNNLNESNDTNEIELMKCKIKSQKWMCGVQKDIYFFTFCIKH